MKKCEKLVIVCAHVVRQDALKGHLRWKVTDLSRAAGVSRSRIYELLGRNKKEILINALRLLIDDLYGRTPERQELHKSIGRFAGVMRSRKIVLEFPELVTFSYLNRARRDEIGMMLRKAEEDYMELLSNQTGVSDQRKLLFMRTMIHGISQAPFLTDAQVEMLLNDVLLYPVLAQK